jgi:hypothetical protein
LLHLLFLGFLTRLFFRIEAFELNVSLVASPLALAAVQEHLQASDLGFQSGVPRYLPLQPQPVFQAFIILNSGWYRSPCVVTRRRLGVDAARAFKTGPEKFPKHVSIAI